MVRYKNRYIAIEILPGNSSDRSLMIKTISLYHAVQQKIQQLYGDFGAGAMKSGLNAKYCNTYTKIALIKVRHGPHKFLLNAIPKINNIGGRLVSVNIIYVGATLKHCFLFIRKFQQKKLEEIWHNCKNDMQRQEMEKALMTLTPDMRSIS